MNEKKLIKKVRERAISRCTGQKGRLYSNISKNKGVIYLPESWVGKEVEVYLKDK